MLDERALFELAARQHSAFTRGQAAASGLDRWALDRRVRRGRVRQISNSVFAFAGSPADDYQLAMAAVLEGGPGAVLSNRSAAALWQLPGFELTPIHVTLPRRAHVRTKPLAVVHTSTCLPPHHATAVSGIPVMLPTRVALDLSGRVSTRQLERTIERMWSRRLTNGPKLYRMLDELSEHGRRRIQAVRDYLEPRGPSYVPMDSNLEMRVNHIVVSDGQEPLVHQVDVGTEVEWIGRVDFLDRKRKLIVEVDSELYHGSDLDRRLDAERRARLVAAGWTIIRIREFDVWHNPALVAADIRRARQLATARV